MASTYNFAQELLTSQRKFSKDALKAAAPMMPGHAESASATETYFTVRLAAGHAA